ncbi:hypothetical protein H8356DRAFT_1054403 [Neocallimastix lanati (nom. inval.)]|uniref:TLC domain-containing protein n=1 Tax=Neocallimastix californiae TaxID=1754190 RepID=A0A1Y2ATN2_9FUNG|nr:hypothetical protein H8356DRAFT_1054403 [Neocallimastix sp. JGI-2020a]ORY25901.1 hypothetical protein LY90DRAFT_629564 [Neocallimastix californiae]|eukprot:ORY25901.1 hypothetical protein LY90DRAFT_629564 [Neocallimastix californiae]
MRTIFESQLNADQYQAYQQLYNDNLRYKKYFIEENRGQRTIMEWLFSRGTNYTCYIQYLYSLNEEQKIENTIDKIRTVVYAIHKPFQFTFFYWTILIFVLYKFNFKNKVLKIISAHLLFRSLGDILDKFGDLYPRYFSNKYTDQLMHDSNHIECSYEVASPEHYPFRWFLTRQIGCTFWLMGEIVADWYSLIRTREIVKSKKTIWYVYATCGLFNFSKIALIFHHWFFFITKIYDENGVYNNEEFGKFYNVYWVMQLIIIYASLFYDISVYYVLKKYSFQISISGVSFVKKFKTYSTYRIYVTALVSAIFLPMISLTIFARLYYYYVLKLKNLDFSFEEIKISITNLQYFIIFIDQILLSYSNENSDSSKKSNKSNKSNNSTRSYSKNSLTKKIRSPNENNSIKTLINNQMITLINHIN